MERLFHVKHMFVALASVPVAASRSQTSLDSMNHRCLYMRFYDAKMGFYEIGMSFYELRRVTGTSLWVT